MNQNRYKKSATNTIDLQLLALKNLKKSLNSSFNKAVKAIGDCQSKCILVGVGKSGHLANLIASSLNSMCLRKKQGSLLQGSIEYLVHLGYGRLLRFSCY